MRKLNVRKYRFLHCKNHVKSKTYLFCQNYVSEPPYRSHTCHRQHICADRFIAFSRDPLQKSEKKLNLFPFPARNLTSRAHEAWQRRRPEEKKKSPIRPGTDTIWCLTWPNGSAKKKKRFNKTTQINKFSNNKLFGVNVQTELSDTETDRPRDGSTWWLRERTKHNGGWPVSESWNTGLRDWIESVRQSNLSGLKQGMARLCVRLHLYVCVLPTGGPPLVPKGES